MEDSLRECKGCDKCPQSQQILCILDAAIQESMKTGEEIKMKKDLAKWFTENYKKYFPGFKGE